MTCAILPATGIQTLPCSARGRETRRFPHKDRLRPDDGPSFENTRLMDHTHSRFDSELDELRRSAIDMADLVRQQLQRAIEAVRTANPDLVIQVLSDEAQVNRMHLQSDLYCHQVIARRQPIAIDLREILAILHMNNDLERIGDEAKKIAKKSRKLAGRSLPIDIARINEMAVRVCSMLQRAIDAFMRRDASIIDGLRTEDKEVDQMRKAITTELVSKMENQQAPVNDALAMIFVAQSLERVGDHAKNIAEYVVTVVDGTDPRYVRSVRRASRKLAQD